MALPKVRNRRLALLLDSHVRLKGIVAELLEKANDLEQHLKYLGPGTFNGEQAKLKCVFDDLVILSDTIPTIDQLISEKKIDETNSMLSAASRLAEKVNGILGDINFSIGIQQRKGIPSSKEGDSYRVHDKGVVDVEIVED